MNRDNYSNTQTRLTVYLPEEMEKAVYADFLTLARAAVEEVTQNIVPKRYINKKELCEMFQCGPAVINGWMAEGLKSFPKGKEIYFDIEDVNEFVNTLKY